MSIAEKLTTIAENEQKVYDAGVQSEYDRFWDAFQDNGNRVNYQSAGLYMFTAETFRPKYDIRPTSMHQMACNSYWTTTLYIEDFVEHCNDCGIVFDISKCTTCNSSLGLIKTRRFGVLDFSSARTEIYMATVFYGNNGYLQTIDEVVSNEKTAWNTSTFQHATGLINMTVTGVIGKNNFNVSYCTKLTHDSLMSIINCLKDYSEDTSGTSWVVTVSYTHLTLPTMAVV